ncbi:MAG TPA: Asp-tRNA(Asn)/Glu-tRNA(Gln) amidotransferase subunit GatC [Elusimicrobiota bacterium]|nr:Asp-tRNA(Asn)/Glu-tRNA(Gln) amidotransferase subunit GatC [Elusimicrobiota bacterium]
MPLSDKDVAHAARLARLALGDEERRLYRDQLERILGYIAKLNELDTAGVPPTSHVVPMANVWREDDPAPAFDTEKILSNAPERDGAYFKVPKVIE